MVGSPSNVPCAESSSASKTTGVCPSSHEEQLSEATQNAATLTAAVEGAGDSVSASRGAAADSTFETVCCHSVVRVRWLMCTWSIFVRWWIIFVLWGLKKNKFVLRCERRTKILTVR